MPPPQPPSYQPMPQPMPQPPQPPQLTEEVVGARLHPLTPFVKGWGYFVIAAFAMANNEGLRTNL
ncbi:MAG: putative rane protein, partial [Chloroflexota bacterium]|nr:putative rane protein [Chloroflexota bacterium]